MEEKNKKQEKSKEQKNQKTVNVEKIKKDLNKSIDFAQVEELIAKNIIEFSYDGVDYRVRKLTYKEKQDAYEKQVQKFTELLNTSDYELEEVLKEKYKKKGLDIDAMTHQMNALEVKKQDYQMKLGKLLKEKAKDADLDTYRGEIEDINIEQLNLSIRKTSLLQYSIEHQAMIYVYSYLTYLITEKRENEESDKWVKAFEKYEDFINSPEDLVNQASAHATVVVGRI